MIHSICGLQNAGKSQFACFLAFVDYIKGRKIVSNMNLNFPHKRINKDFLFWAGEKQPIFRNVTWLLDELWIWLDCRKSIENTIATYFFLQSSKDNSSIYLTSQDNTQNEIRIQKNLHRYTECQRVLYINKKFIPCTIEERDLTRFIDKDGISLNDKLFIKATTFKRILNREGLQYKFHSTTYLKSKEYQKLYNTYEKKVII